MLTTDQVVYVAGPMTNIPQFNFPAFDAASAELRDRGFTVVSPAELDNEETRAAAMASPDGSPGSGSVNDETWGDFLARDVKLVADKVDAIAVIDGWDKSRGACLETFVAKRLCGKRVFYANTLEPVPMRELAAAWLGADCWAEIVLLERRALDLAQPQAVAQAV